MIDVLLVVIAAISLLASGVVIMNNMLANVTERTREIGVVRGRACGRHVSFESSP